MSGKSKRDTSLAEPDFAAESQAMWHQRQAEKNKALRRLVQSWLTEDSQEDPEKMRAEWEEMKQALDEDRLSNRKLFP